MTFIVTYQPFLFCWRWQRLTATGGQRLAKSRAMVKKGWAMFRGNK
jgi:hypothetical protein